MDTGNSTADVGAKCDGECPMRDKIRTIVYWRKPVTSGILLACLLTLQISLMCCSAISVVAFMGLALFLVINGVRMYYKYVCKNEQALIKEYLEKDITIPQDRVNKLATRLTDMANDGLVRARDIFFFKDVAASIKLIVLLYVLTYVGAVFDFMTLVTIATILAFTVPKFYESYQTEVDKFIKIGKDYYDTGVAKLQAQLEKLPVVGNRKQKPQ